MGFRNSMVLPDELKPPANKNKLALQGGNASGKAFSSMVAHNGDQDRFVSSYSATFTGAGKSVLGKLPPTGTRVAHGTFESHMMTFQARRPSQTMTSSAPNLTNSATFRSGDQFIEGPSGGGLPRSTTLKDSRRAIMELLADPDLETIIRETFAKFGKDADANLNLDDVCMVLRYQYKKLGLPAPGYASAERLFKKFDVDNSNCLNFREFFQLCLAIFRQNCFDQSTVLGRDFFVSKHPGSVWSRYEQVKKLGEGSFGTAYLAKQKFTGENRVVKSVKKSRVQMPVEDVEKEIIVMRQVDHPHVVRLRRWYEDSQKIYLVMDVCNGGTLRDVVLDFQKQRRSLKEEWIRTVMMQVSQAMAYCHSLRLIHKDIKDENIMLLRTERGLLDGEPFAVVIDLGIAEMFSPSDPQGKDIGGTPTTMAPEVWLGTFGPKCDVWSLGCVLYQLLTGCMPFLANSLKPQVWIKLHKRGPLMSRIKTSGPSKELCGAMLTFMEEERPTMQQLLKHEWFEVAKTDLKSVSPGEFQQLRRFCDDSALKRGILFELASKLPMDDSVRVVEVFERFDVDNNGTISYEELTQAFRELGIDDGALVQKVFKVCDLDSDGSLSFTEFSSLVLVLFKDLLEDRLDKLMTEFDTEGDGSLDLQSVQQFLAHVGRSIGGGARSEGIVKDLMKSGARKIKFQELKDKLLGTSEEQVLPSKEGCGTPASSRASSTRNMMRSSSGAAKKAPRYPGQTSSTPDLGVQGLSYRSGA